MTQHKGQAEGKNAYHYNADNKSPRRAPQGPLLGSSVNQSSVKYPEAPERQEK